ncbi:hypothetical protein BOS5A_211345 [Bosea sp. EC-HK365B]|nr:hypothetical protein BOSE21B_50347 [Bosea sp. 21B]CAD5289112.1 hypothetical protein BOSE46_70332 [Bosea sp. 46]VVT60553.1 hypothetical protein BOS5A_211345 [Bosea sp. EC-HK365B]VXC92694.1 hypothetical protein BOSE125_70396 [Bosea sp. 125]
MRVPVLEALCGSTFETRKTSSRSPASASPVISSARPSPYISAVSIWERPRSSPRRSAAIASLRGARSMFQVPWPIRETAGPPLPNAAVVMRMILAILFGQGHGGGVLVVTRGSCNPLEMSRLGS